MTYNIWYGRPVIRRRFSWEYILMIEYTRRNQAQSPSVKRFRCHRRVYQIIAPPAWTEYKSNCIHSICSSRYDLRQIHCRLSRMVISTSFCSLSSEISYLLGWGYFFFFYKIVVYHFKFPGSQHWLWSEIRDNGLAASPYLSQCWSSLLTHYNDVIMGAIASQITSLTIVYSTIYSDADQGNIKAPRHWPLCGEWPVTRKIFPFDDVIMVYCVRHSASMN